MIVNSQMINDLDQKLLKYKTEYRIIMPNLISIILFSVTSTICIKYERGLSQCIKKLLGNSKM